MLLAGGLSRDQASILGVPAVDVAGSLASDGVCRGGGGGGGGAAAENSIVMAQGVLQHDGVFHVRELGLPPCEERHGMAQSSQVHKELLGCWWWSDGHHHVCSLHRVDMCCSPCCAALLCLHCSPGCAVLCCAVLCFIVLRTMLCCIVLRCSPCYAVLCPMLCCAAAPQLLWRPLPLP
jgi:hypothetical protein